MNPIPELIAQWKNKQVSGGALMRALVSYDKWCVPVSEKAAAETLAHNSPPSLQLATTPDGETSLAIFSSSEVLASYRKMINAPGSQHFLTVDGKWIFGVPMETLDVLWIDGGTEHDIVYNKSQFKLLHEMVAAIRVEEALTGLRHGNGPENAIQTAREYKNYYLPVSMRNDKPAFVMAPDDKGRSLAAAFTSDDTFDAFAAQAQQITNGAPVQQMQIDGAALFDTFQRMNIDGFVFNCKGPITPVAFQQAVAGIILQG
jgi:hypothetical protein